LLRLALESSEAVRYSPSVVLEIKLDLSESLAQEAKAKGLLESPAIERMLRAELKRSRVNNLFVAADRLAAQELPPLDETEVEKEIEAARTQRRPGNASRR
jgi:hypothetical protein